MGKVICGWSGLGAAMKALKIAGVVILAIWMVFIALQVVHIGRLIQETCTYAQAAKVATDHSYMLDGCH